jgi:hypothetical protein
MATINLGAIKFNWKGVYSGSTAYAVDDVVSYNGSSYVCTAASTGNLPTDTNFWDQMSSAGTNGTDGTDLTSTLTTQGDIVYRDASGLARLGAGTSGQVLQSGGTGANPSWGTVSSDFVKIAEFSHSGSNVTNFDMDNIFSATYPCYRVILHDFLHVGSGAQGWFRAIDNNGNIDTASNYEFANNGRTSSGTDLAGSSASNTYIQLSQDLSSDTEKTSTIVVDVFQPYQNTKYTWFNIHSSFYCNNTSDMRYLVGGGVWKNNNIQCRGLRYTAQGSSNFVKQAKAIIYGLKGAY